MAQKTDCGIISNSSTALKFYVVDPLPAQPLLPCMTLVPKEVTVFLQEILTLCPFNSSRTQHWIGLEQYWNLLLWAAFHFLFV